MRTRPTGGNKRYVASSISLDKTAASGLKNRMVVIYINANMFQAPALSQTHIFLHDFFFCMFCLNHCKNKLGTTCLSLHGPSLHRCSWLRQVE